MNSVILCEGSSDYVLLQYYMRKVHSWQDQGNSSLKYQNNPSRELMRGNDRLTILSSGGCASLPNALNLVLDKIELSSPFSASESINKVVILTDRDELTTEADFLTLIEERFQNHSANHPAPIQNNAWCDCQMVSRAGPSVSFSFLLMVIPFQDTGALETFLLNAVAQDDPYDAEIIRKGKEFVRTADPDEKYLNKRGYKTKAEFDAYFCIRTASRQFAERQNILKNVPWENYSAIQRDFRLLGDL